LVEARSCLIYSRLLNKRL